MNILDRAQETARQLNVKDLCEGHRLMVAQGIAALRHLSRLIEMHQRRAALNAPSPPLPAPVAGRRIWRPAIWRGPASGDAVEASV